MPERGVSRRVTVKFDEIGEGGRLSRDAVQRSSVEEQAEAQVEESAPPTIETEPLDPSTLGPNGQGEPRPLEPAAPAEVAEEDDSSGEGSTPAHRLADAWTAET